MRFFLLRGLGLALVLLVIRGQFERPEVTLHGLLAARLVLLRDEGCLVSGHLVQVLGTSCYSCRHGAETHSLGAFICSDRSRAVVTVRREGVDALTVGVGGCGGTVGHHQVVAVFVSVLFLRTFEGALDVFNTSGTDGCFSHFVFGFVYGLAPYEGIKC